MRGCSKNHHQKKYQFPHIQAIFLQQPAHAGATPFCNWSSLTFHHCQTQPSQNQSREYFLKMALSCPFLLCTNGQRWFLLPVYTHHLPAGFTGQQNTEVQSISLALQSLTRCNRVTLNTCIDATHTEAADFLDSTCLEAFAFIRKQL